MASVHCLHNNNDNNDDDNNIGGADLMMACDRDESRFRLRQSIAHNNNNNSGDDDNNIGGRT